MSDDLIKRSEAIKAMEQRYQDILRIFKRKVKDGEKAIALDMIGCIKSLPSADRPQGEWMLSDLQSQTDNENGNYAYVCTNCNHTDIHAKTQKVPYCWWCGARMKGADDE